MISLTSSSNVLSAIKQAHSIVFSAYFMHPGAMLNALTRAAERPGTHVVVRLEEEPFNDPRGRLAKMNAAAVQTLRACGADARTMNGMHLKAAVCDGVAYLDDRNWGQGTFDTVVRDNQAADADAVCRAIYGHCTQTAVLSTTKAASLQKEAALIDSARQTVEIESESFSGLGPVYGALRRAAQKPGIRCELLVNRNETEPKYERAVDALTALGVDVRFSTCNEKMTVVDGRRAWLGCANATSPYPDPETPEWGLTTRNSRMVRELRRRYEDHWKSAAFTAERAIQTA